MISVAPTAAIDENAQRRISMTAYNYQCAGCYCTLYADALKEGEDYCWVMNGELCSSCKAKQDAQDYNDDD